MLFVSHQPLIPSPIKALVSGLGKGQGLSSFTYQDDITIAGRLTYIPFVLWINTQVTKSDGSCSNCWIIINFQQIDDVWNGLGFSGVAADLDGPL